ncbi:MULTISPECIES: ABC transporter ATP-binding protein [Bacillaceae]|uniref:ABC transporter ATP-binding protein n=1 Tax=Bacillaceae TaxID=186817 RepID=UPI00104FCC1A|nr:MULTISPECIES: ABC transporter ATP-binding protein [Bacillaceae]MDT2047291.1 ABC transporter ATP-binding protein [Priestia flexa]TDB55042.1 ABC transporter ATP-binding protein [Bacillus sp. CBEL-1]
MQKAIEVNELTYSYDKKSHAVNNLSFEVKKGEIFGFLGPSGAGKSTTIKLLTRLISPPPGKVFILGQDMSKVKYSFYKKIGIAFENDVLYPTLTGYENLMLHAKIYGTPKEEVLDMLKKMDLFKSKDKKAGDYSKGMKTRLVLARALVTKPEVLFMDEPTSGMDPEIAAYVREIILNLNKNGTTMFLTTHDMNEAEKLCDRIAFFNKGKIIELDTPENYKKRFGKQVVTVEHNGQKKTFSKQDDLTMLTDIINSKSFDSIHSQEASLEEIFIKVVGRGLKGEA